MPTSVSINLRTTLPGAMPAVIGQQMQADTAVAGVDTFVQAKEKLPAGYFADAKGIVHLNAGLPLMALFSPFAERRRLNELAQSAGMAPANHRLLDQLREAGLDDNMDEHARALLRDLKFDGLWSKTDKHTPESVKSLCAAIECGNFQALEIFLKLASEMELPSDVLGEFPSIKHPRNAADVRVVVDDRFRRKMETGRVPLALLTSMQQSIVKLLGMDQTNGKLLILLKLRNYGNERLRRTIDENLNLVFWPRFIEPAEKGNAVSVRMMMDLYKIDPTYPLDAYAILSSLKTDGIEAEIERSQNHVDMSLMISALSALFNDFGNKNAYQSLINIVSAYKPVKSSDGFSPAAIASIYLEGIIADELCDDKVRALADAAYEMWEKASGKSFIDARLVMSRVALYTRLATMGPENWQYLTKLRDLEAKGKTRLVDWDQFDWSIYDTYTDLDRATRTSVLALKYPITNGQELAFLALLDIAATAKVGSWPYVSVVEAMPTPAEMADKDAEAAIRGFFASPHFDLAMNKLIARVRAGDDGGDIARFLKKIAIDWKSEKWAKFVFNFLANS